MVIKIDEAIEKICNGALACVKDEHSGTDQFTHHFALQSPGSLSALRLAHERIPRNHAEADELLGTLRMAVVQVMINGE